MSVFQTIKERRSIRKYKKEKVDPKIIEKILEAGRLSHSARNAQDWKFIAVTDEKTIEKLAETMGQAFGFDATLMIVGCGLKDAQKMFCNQPRPAVDLSIATQNMQLVAWEEGVGSCWIGHFDAEKAGEILDLEEEYCPITLTTMGYPDEEPKMRPRKAFDDVCFYRSE
ncbi:MAG: nitroreductase family protein [Tissierellia bacterium]|nr:nitroreductase family protein [Tissierellia bacterium]